MESLKHEPEKIVEEQTPHKKLTYVESFKDFFSENPGVISAFLKFEKDAKYVNESGYYEVEYGASRDFNDVRITSIQKSHANAPSSPGSYFKVETKDGDFFVKTIPGFHGKGMGASELSSLSKAKGLLKDIKGVDVVDFQLGYEDDKGKTYFVSKWQDGVVFDEYLESTGGASNPNNLELIDRYQDIAVALRRFADVWEHNVLYDQKTDKLMVFDVHHRGGLW
jgi:hypothetical protein